MPAPVVQTPAAGDKVANAQATLTLPVPAGTVDDDLLMASVAHTGTGITAPSGGGWTLLGTTTAASTPIHGIYLRPALSEPANYGWTFAEFGTSNRHAGVILRITGAHATPIDASASTNSAGATNNNAAAPSVDTTGVNRLLLTFFSQHDGSRNFTPPTGETELFDFGTGATAGPTISGSWENVATATTTGTKPSTMSASGRWTAWTLAIAPVIGSLKAKRWNGSAWEGPYNIKSWSGSAWA